MSTVYRNTRHDQSVALGNTRVNSALTVGLVGLWRMEESVWDGTADEVVDSSGGGNHGVAVNGAVTIAGGKLGRGGDFTAASNEHIDLGNTVGDYTDNFTLAAWFKTSTAANLTILARRDIAANTQYQLTILTAGRIRFFEGVAFEGDTTGLNDGVWHHVVVVIDGAASMIYVDGQPDRDLFNPTIVSNTMDFNIGTAENGAGFLAPFDGQIDEVAIWNRALGSDEVGKICNAGLARAIV